MPLVVERVKKLYGERGAGAIAACPGESNCELGWKEAAGTTHAEREQNACFGCHLFETKPQTDESVIDEEDAEIYIAEVESARRNRDSGAGIDLTAISSLTWKLLLVYDDAVEQHERGLRLYAKALFEVLAQRGI